MYEVSVSAYVLASPSLSSSPSDLILGDGWIGVAEACPLNGYEVKIDLACECKPMGLKNYCMRFLLRSLG